MLILLAGVALGADSGLEGFASLKAGAGVVGEAQTGNHGSFGGTADGGVIVGENLRFQGHVSNRVYTHTYWNKNAGVDGAFEEVDVNEQYQLFGLGTAIDVFAKSDKVRERSELWLDFIPRVYRFGNRTFRQTGGSLGVGVDGVYRPVPTFGLLYSGAAHVSQSFTGTTLSALGRPLAFADLSFGAQVAGDEEGKFSLELRYRADFIGFQHAIRSMHAGLAGITIRL